MAIVKIEDVYLYVSEVVPNAAENLEATAFMDHSGIKYTRLFYNNENDTQNSINAVNTWWSEGTPPITGYPFLTYVEVHDDIPARQSPVKYLEGIEAIKTFPDLFKSVNG